MVDLHVAVVHGAKDGDDRYFSCCHFAKALQIFISLLHIHGVVYLGSCDQLVDNREQSLNSLQGAFILEAIHRGVVP